MFLIDVSYAVPFAEIEKLASAHRAYAAIQCAAGKYLMSGRKLPKTGGFILATVSSRAELDAIIAGDPFHQAAVAIYEITEVQVVMARADVKHLLAESE